MGFKDDDGKVYNLIDHLNMQLDEGKALGIVGESGCGKSMTSLSLMRLLPAAASVQGGEILLNGEDLLKKSEPEMEKIRGKQIAMIFQEPMTALNPVMTIGKQIGECLKLHHPEMKEDEIRKQVCEALNDVGIANPETRIDQYPHEFSGGMRQRVMHAAFADHRRRTDHRIGCNDPGADPGYHAPPEGILRQFDADYAQSGDRGRDLRGGGGDVCGPCH